MALIADYDFVTNGDFTDDSRFGGVHTGAGTGSPTFDSAGINFNGSSQLAHLNGPMLGEADSVPFRFDLFDRWSIHVDKINANAADMTNDYEHVFCVAGGNNAQMITLHSSAASSAKPQVQIRLRAGDNSGNLGILDALVLDSDLFDGSDHSFTWVYNGVTGKVSIYIDGTIDANANNIDLDTSIAEYFRPLDTVTLGARDRAGTPDGYWEGTIGGIKFFDHALSAADAAALHAGTYTETVNNSYHIGNSLTGNAVGQPGTIGIIEDGDVNAATVDEGHVPLYYAFARQRGIDVGHAWGNHIRSSRTLLDHSINLSNTGSTTPSWPAYGPYNEGVSGSDSTEWDNIIFQPHQGTHQDGAEAGNDSKRAQDVSAIESMIELANVKGTPKVWIYAAWPGKTTMSYSTNQDYIDYWDTPLSGTNTKMLRGYFEQLKGDLEAVITNEVGILWVGEVFYKIAQDNPSGTTIGDMMDSNLHMTNGIGRYTASLALWCLLTGVAPGDYTAPSGYWGDPAISQAEYDLTHASIAAVQSGAGRTQRTARTARTAR